MPTINYIAEFPIPEKVLPARLRSLLEPVGYDPDERVAVTTDLEFDQYGPNQEYVQMVMAVICESIPYPIPILDEAGNGVVAFSVPVLGKKGASHKFEPSISGHDFIVASWGDGSYYTYNLAEKVWMALGLTPRCLGNNEQRLVYDDLGMPEFSVAEGEVSREYHYSASRNVSWRMSNEYLRKYLWMRGCRGVRAFFYQALCPDIPELRNLMSGTRHISIQPDNSWYNVDIREDQGSLLLQVWASVEAVSCELCPEQTAENVSWPGVTDLVTHASADAMLNGHTIYIDDKFLERYEQSSFYETVPRHLHGAWFCSPSYRGQWAFTDCRRVGRNLIRVSLRELYKPKPEREILHARVFLIDPAVAAHFDQNEEHIVSKTKRLVDQLLILGENLSAIGSIVGIDKTAIDIVGFSRAEIDNNGWLAYPQLCRLAQVAPLDMTQQAFLARCKSLHEVWQKVPNGFLKRLLEAAGCPRNNVKELGSLKLLQSLLNISERLDADEELSDAFLNPTEVEGWNTSNESMAALFVANDLRIADAHETFDESLQRLQDLGFDIASLHQGYGKALDFVMDVVIEAFVNINQPMSRILGR
jgi:hypothetical protein